MFCPDCGQQNDDNVKFCSSCGAILQTDETTGNQETPPDNPTPPSNNPYGSQPGDNYGQPGGGSNTQSSAPTSPLAIWSLVLSLVGFFCCGPLSSIPAIIVGHIAMNKINESPDTLKGKEMALIGTIIGYIVSGLYILLIIISIIMSVTNQDVGDMFDF